MGVKQEKSPRDHGQEVTNYPYIHAAALKQATLKQLKQSGVFLKSWH